MAKTIQYCKVKNNIYIYIYIKDITNLKKKMT